MGADDTCPAGAHPPAAVRPGVGRAHQALRHRTGPGTPACAGLATGPWPAAPGLNRHMDSLQLLLAPLWPVPWSRPRTAARQCSPAPPGHPADLDSFPIAMVTDDPVALMTCRGASHSLSVPLLGRAIWAWSGRGSRVAGARPGCGRSSSPCSPTRCSMRTVYGWLLWPIQCRRRCGRACSSSTRATRSGCCWASWWRPGSGRPAARHALVFGPPRTALPGLVAG